jgi:hypothetical protein
MGLESATYISGLNAANPVSGDTKSQGDDHIRLVKATLQATFPNVTGAVTPTHTELNFVDGVTSALQTQLNAKQATISGSGITKLTCSSSAPSGTITGELWLRY